MKKTTLFLLVLLAALAVSVQAQGFAKSAPANPPSAAPTRKAHRALPPKIVQTNFNGSPIGALPTSRPGMNTMDFNSLAKLQAAAAQRCQDVQTSAAPIGTTLVSPPAVTLLTNRMLNSLDSAALHPAAIEHGGCQK